MEYVIPLSFFMIVVRIIAVITVTRSERFRRCVVIPDYYVNCFCWLVMVPILGELIFGVSLLISLVNFINKNVFVVK